MDPDFMSGTPVALLELNLDELVGLDPETARERVEAAGGHLRAVRPGQPVTADYRGDRVTVITEDGRISEVTGIG